MAYQGYGQPPPGGYGAYGQQPPPGGAPPTGYPQQQPPPGGAPPTGYHQQQPPPGGAPTGYHQQQPPPGGAPTGYHQQQPPPGGAGYPQQPQQQQTPSGYPSRQAGYPPAGGGYPGTAPSSGGCPPGIDPTIYSWFVTVDADKSGAITSTELQQALTNGNWSHFNPETCRLMIGLFDRDGNGTIDINEFQQLWQYINQWKGVFDRYDKDRSGNIDVNELYTAYNEMGFRVSMAFCQLVVMRFDRLNKRCLRFDDFIQSCVMLRSLTDAFKTRDTSLRGIIQVSYEDFMAMAISNKP